MNANQPQSMTLEAVVIRADGSKEDLGAVAYWNKNPLIRLIHRLKGEGVIQLRN